MKNIWWIVCLIAIGAATWYFNQNYLSKNPPATPAGNNLTGNPVASGEAKEVLVFIAPDGKTKTVNLEASISVLDKPLGDWPNPVFSPDGQNQALVEFSNAERDFGYSLYVANKNGTNKKKIVQNDEAIASPRWSSDGLSVYYLQAKSGLTKIMQMEIASSLPREILSEEGMVSDLVAIKDNYVAYLLRSDAQSEGIGDIIIASTDGKTQRILTKGTKILGWLN